MIVKPSKSPARGRAMAVTNHPAASAAAAIMLAEGGTAVDGAVAGLLALSVCEPMMVGLFGGGVFHLRDAAGAHTIFDGLSTAPAAAHATMFTRMLRGWSDDVTAFVAAGVDVDEAALREAGIRVERRAIVALVGDADALTGVRVDGGDVVTVNALLVRPKQEPTPLVQTLAARGLKLDGAFIAVDDMKRSSFAGIFATGDAITPGQSAALGVGAGAFVAGAVNLELSA